MANNGNEINTGKATSGEFSVSYQTNGYGAVIPVIDGTPHPELMMGFVSEADRQAGLDLIAGALKATGGNIPQAMAYMYQAAQVAASEIKAEEAVSLEDGPEIIVSYTDRKAYLGTEEIASLQDMTCELPREAVKAILVERAKAEITRLEQEAEDDISDVWDEYNDCAW